MKKILSTLSAAAMLVAAVALVGCSGAVQANPTDILEELEAPSVTAKAYPGFIRLTWDKVNGASGYRIYRDGFLISGNNALTVCEYPDVAGTDNNLINGIKYTYDVVAFAGDDYANDQNSTTTASARAVYVKQAMTTVTETANVPSVADFDEQYKDYFEKFTGEDKTFKTELVTVNGDSYIKVTAPTVPEFNYTVYTFVDNTPDYLKASNTVSAFKIEAENETAFFRPVTGSGSYNVSVKVSPVSQLYSAKEFAGSKAEVKDLNSTAINGSAKFTTTKTVRITWTPSTYNNVDFAAAEYSVFRKSAGSFTKVAGDVAVLNAGDINGSAVVESKTYYIDDTVEEGSSPRYYIVLTKDGETKGSNPDGIIPAAVTSLGGTVAAPTAVYVDAGKTARISFTPAQEKTDTVGMYAVYRKLNNTTNLEKLGALKATTSTAIAGNGKVTLTDKFYVEDTIKDNKVGYTYLIYRTENNATSQNGTATLNAYSIYNDATRGTISATAVQNNNDRLSNDVYIRFTLGNIDNTFTLYRADTTYNSNPLDSDYTVVTGYAFGATSATGREYVMFDADRPVGSYRYKLVESAKDKNDVASFANVTVSANGVSGLSVQFASTTHALEFYDSYNNVSEKWDNYSYSYIVVTRTYNNISGYQYYTYSDAAAATVQKALFADQYPTSTSTTRSMKAVVSLPLTASAANAATTNSYQVIAIKTDSASGKNTYAITSGWVASN